MSYSELIKNFEKVRTYMRDFYVYGFKSRNEFNAKSLRSYDDERRRIESWLGDYMRFKRTSEGKNVFISIDSRNIHENPFYKAWKSKTFTDGDITLHFAIFDILHSPEIHKTLNELIEDIDCLLDSKISFDESTLRKKLKEYVQEGIIKAEKKGRKIYYSRSLTIDISNYQDVIDFYSEVAPCGVIGSFLKDKLDKHDGIFLFKHHYITQAIDSEIMVKAFLAMSEHRYITVKGYHRHQKETKKLSLVPLKIYISAQNGRQYLMAYEEKTDKINSYRLDYLTDMQIEEKVCLNFEHLRQKLNDSEKYMWGVSFWCKDEKLERVEFDIFVQDDEDYIIRRLEREKRCGRVYKIDDKHYHFVAEVFDAREMFPWLRTFISRIVKINFSNNETEKLFKDDLKKMYEIYEIDEVEDESI